MNSDHKKILLIIDTSEAYGRDLLKGIIRYAEGKHWTFCKMPPSYRDEHGINGIIQWCKSEKPDGIIAALRGDKETQRLLETKIPLIAQDFETRFKEIPNLSGNYSKTGKIAAEYFMQKGFKNFAFYGFRNMVWSQERFDGFEVTLQYKGYKVDVFNQNDSQELWYYQDSELDAWLQNLPKPVAVFCCDDNQAFHISEACKNAEILIPEEVSVLGVDNDETICSLVSQPISSIALNTEHAGFKAADLLDKVMQTGKTLCEDIIVEPDYVITRQSTDIFATEDLEIAKCLNFIHQNIHQELNVGRITTEVPLSRRALEKRFKKVTGLSIYKYVNNLRIQKFCKLLIETDLSVWEISLGLGLVDSKNASRLFKQFTGFTPLAYRKKHK